MPDEIEQAITVPPIRSPGFSGSAFVKGYSNISILRRKNAFR
jgi:nitrogenase molybdenum-iron protein alpha/beta subunit